MARTVALAPNPQPPHSEALARLKHCLWNILVTEAYGGRPTLVWRDETARATASLRIVTLPHCGEKGVEAAISAADTQITREFKRYVALIKSE